MSTLRENSKCKGLEAVMMLESVKNRDQWGLNIKNKWKDRVTEMIEGYRPRSRLEAVTQKAVIF